MCAGSQEVSPYHSSYLLLEEARKSWEHALSDKVVYVLQPLKIASDSFMGIPKGYVDGRYWIESHLTFEIKRDTHHACILVKFDERYASPGEVREAVVTNCAVGRNPSMLVNVAEEIQPPEQVALDGCGIPSVIWLKRFDEGCGICGYASGVPSESFVVSDFENRELSAVRIGRGQFRQSPYKLVQGRTEAVQEVADDQRNLVGNVFDVKAKDVPLIFNIVLFDNSYRFRFAKGAEPIPHVIKMFLRPDGLQIGVS